MVGKNNEGAVAQEIIEFRYSPFYRICLSFHHRLVPFRRVECLGSDRYDDFLPVVGFLHQNCSTRDVAGEGEKFGEVQE